MFEVLGSSCFGFESKDGNYYKVSTMALGMIYIYSEQSILQGFTRPANVDADNLAFFFNDEKVMMKNAILGKDGTTDKIRFVAEVDRFITGGRLKEEDREILSTFIHKTQFKPETVRKQLNLLGYGDISDDISFEEHTEFLKNSCNVFSEFLHELVRHQRGHNVIQQSINFPE